MEAEGMYRPSKGALIALIAVILVFVIIVICMPTGHTEELNADLIVVVETDAFIGSVGVSYTRWDGSAVSGGAVNADGSPISRSDKLYFEIEGWPATISVYADVQGVVLLASCTIEEAPYEGHIWQLSVREKGGAVVFEPVIIEKAVK